MKVTIHRQRKIFLGLFNLLLGLCCNVLITCIVKYPKTILFFNNYDTLVTANSLIWASAWAIPVLSTTSIVHVLVHAKTSKILYMRNRFPVIGVHKWQPSITRTASNGAVFRASPQRPAKEKKLSDSPSSPFRIPFSAEKDPSSFQACCSSTGNKLVVSFPLRILVSDKKGTKVI